MAKAAQAQTFGSILDRAPSEIEKPKPLPPGSYITVVVGQPRFDKSSKKQTPFVEFQHKILSASEDVDPDDLKAYLSMADGSTRKLTDVTVKNILYDTPAAGYRIKQFVQDCGLDVGDEETGDKGEYDTLREAVEETSGKQVGIFIKHEPFQDGSGVQARVDRTFVIE